MFNLETPFFKKKKFKIKNKRAPFFKNKIK